MDESLCCPITHEVFVDPVTDREGNNYERAAILQWLHAGHTTSPLTIWSRTLVCGRAYKPWQQTQQRQLFRQFLP